MMVMATMMMRLTHGACGMGVSHLQLLPLVLSSPPLPPSPFHLCYSRRCAPLAPFLSLPRRCGETTSWRASCGRPERTCTASGRTWPSARRSTRPSPSTTPSATASSFACSSRLTSRRAALRSSRQRGRRWRSCGRRTCFCRRSSGAGTGHWRRTRSSSRRWRR
jgi:hypothetical protein